jgi:hypothetical protein
MGRLRIAFRVQALSLPRQAWSENQNCRQTTATIFASTGPDRNVSEFSRLVDLAAAVS